MFFVISKSNKKTTTSMSTFKTNTTVRDCKKYAKWSKKQSSSHHDSKIRRPAAKSHKASNRLHSKNLVNFAIIRKKQHLFKQRKYNLLSKLLKVCPTPGYYNKKHLKKDKYNFLSKTNLKLFFILKDILLKTNRETKNQL